MDDFEFVPDPNAHLSTMGGIALRISELLLPRPWWIAEYDSPALLTSDGQAEAPQAEDGYFSE